MIRYVIPNNIDDRILSQGAQILNEGGLLAVPTDTSWAIVCSFKSKEGIKKLRNISKERDEQHFTLLCSELSQFSELCSLNNSHFRLINRLAPGPYVFILKTFLNTEKALNLKRREIGVRIPDSPIPIALVRELGSPLYSITAKRSMLPAEPAFNSEEDDPRDQLFEAGWEMEDINGIDLILDSGVEQERVFSTVLDISGDEVTLIRQG
ncbi:MAG: L-threonylcarbamoyladenylate synthase [Treponema sp.]|jgi:tRNA threonylcarbamoyl adenosine modification protein (Sua5/YciO/YrdC/YwlC family)|nr:L-threonylcarbamoyladenylate synthase [Treponema sp.]